MVEEKKGGEFFLLNMFVGKRKSTVNYNFGLCMCNISWRKHACVEHCFSAGHVMKEAPF